MANDCPKCTRVGFPSPESVEAEQKKRLGEITARVERLLTSEKENAELRKRFADLEGENVRLKAALADLLTGISVHNERTAGRTDIPVPRIEGPVVTRATTVLRGGA